MIRTVTFRWDDSIGDCEECGNPVAFVVIDAYGTGQHMNVCSVCAAVNAADGGATIEWHPNNVNHPDNRDRLHEEVWA
jgi:hypothetical protein